MAFLLDTDVVSELRKTTPDPHVLEWHQRHTHARAYISTLGVGEIRQGIERLRPRDPTRARVLDRWLAELVSAYQDRILPVSVNVAQEWGRLSASAQAPPVVDGLMAATAKVYQLTLVTRNIADVGRTGVVALNPFGPDQAGPAVPP